ncbi:Starch-binding associating with outer membrane [Filimonas lacunae]|uniref:Starch-binding associating with outer membrane n=1 Tax=Filimonas lacunae TaxID=477680 RepID=A0A173MG23_9BACT|nr:RagB/SusD family nutrient uptake outer membrane protein [Filimonas lacunae]BAV06381.1 outer membrane protein, nutrient binding [Filimonas lacunae]SIT26718.1 Starch-binding associating with outer membrane [Filimonas lacunae]
MKKHIIIYTSLLLLIFSACKKFVKEELVSTLTYDYYKTDQGLEDLVKSAYVPTRFKFENEQCYALFNFGTDEFRLGDQFNYSFYNTYDQASLNPAQGFVNDLWTNNYNGINICNLGIAYIPAYNNPASKTLATEAAKNQRVAELRFLRGYYYFQLVQQFGSVPLVVQSASSGRSDFTKETVANVYKQIIADLQFASQTLTVTVSEAGRATKGAANHFLAKAYLTRGSAVTDQRGQQSTDMDSAIYYAELVINSGTYVLEADYLNLWKGVYPKGYPKVAVTATINADGDPPYNTNYQSTVAAGDYAEFQTAQASKEIIFAAQFSNVLNLNGASGTGGNRAHLFYVMQYDAGIPGLVRTTDNFNMRPYRRLRPTDYTIDLFDRKNDSRFYKIFRTAYYRNNGTSATANNAVAKWTATDAPSAALIGKPRYTNGDTAAFFIVNNKTTTLTSADLANTNRFRYVTFARYYKNASGVLTEGFSDNKYLTLVKHLDPVRATPNYNEEKGVRNGILARFAETYLIAAEAYGRKANYSRALDYINIVRRRAAYHAGEFKNPATWIFDGSTKDDVNSTEANLQATTDLFTSNAASEQYPSTVSSTADRFIHFMLNERTRELCGEFYRWEDLVRTETLVSRTKQFNLDATFIDDHFKLRPIPSLQIDATTIGGQPMTDDQKKAYQNPGY